MAPQQESKCTFNDMKAPFGTKNAVVLRMKLVFLLLAAANLAFAADPLREATIQQVINQVRVLDLEAGASHPASEQEKITAIHGVRTGIRSRAELLFQDQTIARLGAETFFTFKRSSREIRMDAGTLLLQIPKDEGGARIRSGSVTASVTGTTVLIEHLPNKNLKMMVLEGHMRVAVSDRFGEALVLKSGEMLTMHPGARTLPDPVQVDIATIMRTSQLIAPPSDKKGGKGFRPLPSAKLIEKAAAKQAASAGAAKKKKSGAVVSSGGAPMDIAAGLIAPPPPSAPAARPVPPPQVVAPPRVGVPPPVVTDPHIRPGIGGSQ